MIPRVSLVICYTHGILRNFIWLPLGQYKSGFPQHRNTLIRNNNSSPVMADMIKTQEICSEEVRKVILIVYHMTEYNYRLLVPMLVIFPTLKPLPIPFPTYWISLKLNQTKSLSN